MMARALVALSMLLVLGEIGRRWWLHPREEHWRGVAIPWLDLPALESDSGFSRVPLAGHVETGPLRFDEAAYLLGTHGPGDPLAVLFFSYRPGNRNLWTDLFTHPPEVCMRSSGCALETTFPARALLLGDQPVPVRILKYREPGGDRPLFVLKAVWLPAGSPIQPEDSVADLRALWVSMALHRIPHPPGAILLAGIWGVEQEAVAWDIFQERVGRHVHLAATPGI